VPTDTSRRCQYQRKNRTRCKAHAQNGSAFCFLHDPTCDGFTRRCLRGLPVLVHEVSRRAWGLRLRQTERELALSLPLMLPSAITRASASGLHLFGAPYPPHLFPCCPLRRAPRDAQRKTRGRVDRLSFLVRLLPPLLHAGLARRTVTEILQQLRLCGDHRKLRRDSGTDITPHRPP
jgi:hypothetical protein